MRDYTVRLIYVYARLPHTQTPLDCLSSCSHYFWKAGRRRLPVDRVGARADGNVNGRPAGLGAMRVRQRDS